MDHEASFQEADLGYRPPVDDQQLQFDLENSMTGQQPDQDCGWTPGRPDHPYLVLDIGTEGLELPCDGLGQDIGQLGPFPDVSSPGPSRTVDSANIYSWNLPSLDNDDIQYSFQPFPEEEAKSLFEDGGLESSSASAAMMREISIKTMTPLSEKFHLLMAIFFVHEKN